MPVEIKDALGSLMPSSEDIKAVVGVIGVRSQEKVANILAPHLGEWSKYSGVASGWLLYKLGGSMAHPLVSEFGYGVLLESGARLMQAGAGEGQGEQREQQGEMSLEDMASLDSQVGR